MSTAEQPTAEQAAAAMAPAAALPTGAPSGAGTRLAVYVLGAAALLGLASSALLWQRLGHIQELLARQSQEANAQAIEARTLAKQAQEQATEAAARLAVQEARVNEVALQRNQLQELMQSLSRSRDENLVVDIESGLRLAQQQAQLTGNLEPLVAALKSAQQRIERAAQPRLAPVQRAIGRDLERLSSASVTDTAGLLARLDDLVRQIDELPLQNAVAQAAHTRRLQPSAANTNANAQDPSAWWSWLQRGMAVFFDEAKDLIRVGRIDQPEAVLLAPEQAFFLRENLKLKLLNARLGVLGRQFDSARTDLQSATAALNRYFDPAARRTQTAATLLQQLQAGLKVAEMPRPDETLSALSTAAAGR